MIFCRPIRTDKPGGDYVRTAYNSFGTPTAQNITVYTPAPAGTGVTERSTQTFMNGFGQTRLTVIPGATSSVLIYQDVTYSPQFKKKVARPVSGTVYQFPDQT